MRNKMRCKMQDARCKITRFLTLSMMLMLGLFGKQEVFGQCNPTIVSFNMGFKDPTSNLWSGMSYDNSPNESSFDINGNIFGYCNDGSSVNYELVLQVPTGTNISCYNILVNSLNPSNGSVNLSTPTRTLVGNTLTISGSVSRAILNSAEVHRISFLNSCNHCGFDFGWLLIAPQPLLSINSNVDCNTGYATISASSLYGPNGSGLSVYQAEFSGTHGILTTNQNTTTFPYVYSTTTTSSGTYTFNYSLLASFKFEDPNQTGHITIDFGCKSSISTTIVVDCCPHSKFNLGLNTAATCTEFKSSLMSPSSSTTTVLNGLNKNVDGNIIVDKNMEIKSCNFTMSPGTMILVDKNVSLTITDSKIDACVILWQGIILNDDSKLFIRGSNIKDAYQAVSSKSATSNMIVDIKTTNFTNNYWGIYLENYVGNLNLGNNRFVNDKQVKFLNKISYNCRSVMQDPGTLLLDGTGGSVAGIEFKNINPSNGIANVNKSQFNNLHFGIINSKSNLNVDDSKFNNILEAGIWTKEGIGSNSQNTTVTLSKFVNMGTLNLLNYGKLLQGVPGSGIVAVKNVNLTVDNCLFSKTNAWGIYYAFNTLSNLVVGTVKGNRFLNNNFAGILAYESVRTNISIKNNNFDFTGTPYATGIIIEDVFVHNENQNNITWVGGLNTNEFNRMDNVREGIRIVNRFFPQVILNRINLSGYQIKDRSRGIYLVNCISTKEFNPSLPNSSERLTFVTQNRIDMFSGLLGSYLDVGIEARDCKGAVITRNFMNNVGRGLWFEKDNLGLTIGCNTMRSNEIGLVLNNGQLSPQGNANLVYENRWITPMGNAYTFAQDCDASQALIFAPSNSNFNIPFYCPQVNNKTNIPGFEFKFQNALSTATAPFGCNIPTKQKDKYNNVVKDSLMSTAFIPQSKFQSDFFTLRDFIQDSTLLSLDSSFVTYKDTMTNSLQYKLASVNYLISNGDYIAAKAANDAIVCTCTNSSALQAVNRIYLETFAQGIDTFTVNQHDSLVTIAQRNSIEYGYGVIQARVMLHSYADTTVYADSMKIITVNKTNFVAQNEEFETEGWKIYPNPVQNELNIDYSQNWEGTISIKDLTGRIVLTQTVDGNVKIKTNELPEGIYLLHIQPFGMNEFVSKLVIQK